MRKLVFIATLLMLAACGEEKSKEQQLAEYRQQMAALKEKISTLEEELSEEDTKSILVHVEDVAYQEFISKIEVTGNVEADEDITVSPETGGNIISINVVEGDHVKKGTILGHLNTETVEQSIKDIEVQVELANTIYERQKTLWEQNIGSEIEYLQSKSTKESLEQQLQGLKAQLDMAIITSPISGVIDRIYQKKGEMGGPQIPFAKVVNISTVKIYAEVSEAYLNAIHAGDTVEVEFPAIDKKLHAPVFRKSSTINQDNRTFLLRINLNNYDEAIKPNLVSILHVRDFYQKKAIVVPSLLVKSDFTGKYLYVATQSLRGKWSAKKRYVEVGRSSNNSTLLISGLEPGDKLITQGFDQVADGMGIAINTSL